MFFLFKIDLDNRVVVLEENGGNDGNSSVAELEVRVETLEGTAADHESRLTTAETNINGKINGTCIFGCIYFVWINYFCCCFVALVTVTSDQEVRLSAAEQNIQSIMNKSYKEMKN